MSHSYLIAVLTLSSVLVTLKLKRVRALWLASQSILPRVPLFTIFIEADIAPFEKQFNLSGNMCITLAQIQEAGLYIDRKEWVSGSHSSEPPIPGFRK